MKKLIQIFVCAALVGAAGFIFESCYTSFSGKEVDFKTYPIHKQDTIIKK